MIYLEMSPSDTLQQQQHLATRLVHLQLAIKHNVQCFIADSGYFMHCGVKNSP